MNCSRALLCLTKTNEPSASRLDAPRRTVEILVLSPLGVLSQFQNRGISTRLVEHALAAADAHRAPLVFLEGSPYAALWTAAADLGLVRLLSDDLNGHGRGVAVAPHPLARVPGRTAVNKHLDRDVGLQPQHLPAPPRARMSCPSIASSVRREVWPAGESLPARLVWGAHTPTDRTTVLADVVAGYGAGVCSLETAVRMLQEAGYPVEDVAEEVDRIQRRAFDQAARLADATGDNAAVREYLGLPEADPGVPPVPLIPGQPTAPATAPGGYTAQPSALLPHGQSGQVGPTGPGPR
ncbi:hypothetical protein OG930_43620 [Streptomyces sp. NBC_01799]|nr:hypothetical protein OG930_43620 [Streptomyces sp. NBC_01799]